MKKTKPIKFAGNHNRRMFFMICEPPYVTYMWEVGVKL